MNGMSEIMNNSMNHNYFQSNKKALSKILIIIVVIIIFILSYGGWSVIKFLNEPTGFRYYQSDPRILYEPGAEEKAKIIKESLNQKVDQIEKKQFCPFHTQIKIYVFSNLTNYEKHSPSKGTGGHTFGSRYIILSPKEKNTPERLPTILAHELSHLHLFGYTGVIKALLLPAWFKEGLAVWASDGAGAENVTEEEATHALLSGLQINPIYRDSILWGKKSHPKNMETHMFYRQSAMFIKFLYQNDKTHFKNLLLLVQKKGDLKYAIRSVYHKSLELIWSDFLKSIK
jgi:hypothetical protein